MTNGSPFIACMQRVNDMRRRAAQAAERRQSNNNEAEQTSEDPMTTMILRVTMRGSIVWSTVTMVASINSTVNVKLIFSDTN